ncbi:hypothetical protein DQ238_08390 [Geodermatophilus sp. TF02-6]|uniref:cupredoxin domain-containing protein n=1 Tax=Geodermatophilus sp. TF02-6 TaxID=2250575 RepID=UPI000DE8895B|nr:plastocyanin/azurin family copper-binding protein [Geodermatophilus sp. TF02-6]RBY80588.1 hypothetical protein DQ238_08390 [Geodermatophilus sp. TF02-6]
MSPSSRSARRTSPRTAALVLALGAALLGSCSDGGDGAGTTDAAATSAAAPSPTASSPTAPTGATPSASPSVTPSESPGSASPTQTEDRTVTATEGEMYVELSEDTLSPGSYTIEVVNEGNVAHDLVVEQDGEDVAGTDRIAPGGSATLTVTLEEGEYVFYCSIGNHRAMGMETTVTVAA